MLSVLSNVLSKIQATTAIVEKTVRAFYSTIAVVCCMERSIYLHRPRYLRSPSFRGYKPDECKPQLNGQYDTDEEEFGEPNELDIGFREPF